MQSWYQEVLQNIFLACPQSQYNFIILTSDIKMLILKLYFKEGQKEHIIDLLN